MAFEKGKPNDARLREYRDVALPALTRRLQTVTPIYDELEFFNLTDSLIQLQKEFGDRLEVRWLMAGRLAEDVAKDLVEGTKLKDVEVRKRYLDGGLDAIYASDDPMIKLALLVDPVSRTIRKRYETEVEPVETKNGALIAQAMFKIKGTSIPPDATGTLRLSFGRSRAMSRTARRSLISRRSRGSMTCRPRTGTRIPTSFRRASSPRRRPSR